MKNILIIGATSAIAEAAARRWAASGNRLYLLGRRAEQLSVMAADLKIRGASEVRSAVFDADDMTCHAETLDSSAAALGRIDIVLIAYGFLPDQQACQRDAGLTLAALTTNAVSVISLLTHLANRFEAQRHGTLAVIGSVAGDRGRQSNYVYGTAKAALAVFLQGLRNRLHDSGVHVLTIKPGLVDTPMTAAFAKGPLWASPERVADGILKAIDRRSDVVYLPGFWRFIMLAVRAVPELWFKRMSL